MFIFINKCTHSIFRPEIGLQSVQVLKSRHATSRLLPPQGGVNTCDARGVVHGYELSMGNGLNRFVGPQFHMHSSTNATRVNLHSQTITYHYYRYTNTNPTNSFECNATSNIAYTPPRDASEYIDFMLYLVICIYASRIVTGTNTTDGAVCVLDRFAVRSSSDFPQLASRSLIVNYSQLSQFS